MDERNFEIQGLYENGIFMSASGDYSKALEFFNEVLRIDPEHVDALINKAISVLKLKAHEFADLERNHEAISCLNKILEIRPNDLGIIRWKGILLVYIGEYEDAITYLNRMLENKPYDVDALLWKGVALGQTEKYEDAIEHINKALKIEPENTDVLANKGLILYRLDKYDEALALFDKVLDLTDEKHPFAMLYKSIILLKQGDATSSIIMLERLLDLEPSYIERIQKHDAFKILSDNPRFQKLIKISSPTSNEVHRRDDTTDKSSEPELRIDYRWHWIQTCLEKAKAILLIHHNSGEIINKFSFSLFVQKEKPHVYAYITGESPNFRIGIHPELAKDFGKESTEESERIKRMLVVVFIHELLHTIYGSQEGKVQFEEKIIANRANYKDALVELENLALSGKMHFCPEN